MKPIKYTIQEFKEQFPDDDTCLDYIFNSRFDSVCSVCKKGKFYRVRKRKCYACSNCGYQVHPVANTIFHKSETKLTLWFYAIFLFSHSRNGVSAMELQRSLGVTYKTAWRMARQIRFLMEDDGKKLSGVVETDETYIGGKHKRKYMYDKKSVVLGAVNRGGAVKTKKVDSSYDKAILDNIDDSIEKGSQIMSDQHTAYLKTKKYGYNHSSVNHSRNEYVRGEVHTNTIEGFWSQLKRSIHGTYHSVSAQHLQLYLDE